MHPLKTSSVSPWPMPATPGGSIHTYARYDGKRLVPHILVSYYTFYVKAAEVGRSSVEQATVFDSLLRPVFMRCVTKNAKVVAISLGSLQWLIALNAVLQSAVAFIVHRKNDERCHEPGCRHSTWDPTNLGFLDHNFPSVHGELLGEDSRITVVSSTAPATLCQLVMFIFGNNGPRGLSREQ
ncbi:hypothetical protein DFH29DRAFT_69332 [Suillus ampliporus]|nr:hypothetical protein DFH29DRAFT_69332 [Suillus ampliporus]